MYKYSISLFSRSPEQNNTDPYKKPSFIRIAKYKYTSSDPDG